MFRYLTTAALVILFASVALAQAPADRGAAAQTGRAVSTLELLNRRVPDANFTDAPFRDVMDWIAELTGANVWVRWQVLEDAGIDPDTPITIKAKNLRLSQVLWMVMNEAGGNDLKLSYRAQGNSILLSTEENLGTEMVVKIYDLRDMLVTIARFDAPQMDAGQALSNSGSGSSNLFNNRNNNDNSQSGGANSAELTKIIQVISSSIEPDSWAAAGGRGTIYDFNGMIIVYNTPLVHQQIGGFVEQEEGP